MALLNNGTPAAPPAPGVKSITGVGQQNSTISGALAGQPKVEIPSQQLGMPEQEKGLGGLKGTGVKMTTKAPVRTKPPKPGQPNQIPMVGFSPKATFAEKPDPRDSIYWQNVQALEATLGPMGTEMIALQGEQDRADIAFSDDTQQQQEYYRMRKRDLAEARLGTGSAYTGSARRDQTDNTYNFLVDMGRREKDKSNADFSRSVSAQDIANRYQAGLRAEEAAGARRIYDSLNAQAESGIDPTEPITGDKNASIRRQVRGTTKRIKTLRGKLEDTNSETQRKRLEKRIARLRRRRSNLQGKISGT